MSSQLSSQTRMFSIFGEIKPKCKGGSILLLHGHSCPIDHLGPKKKGFNEQKLQLWGSNSQHGRHFATMMVDPWAAPTAAMA